MHLGKHAIYLNAGFIKLIVRPIWDVCGDMLDILTTGDNESISSDMATLTSTSRPWQYHLTHNLEQWAAKREQTNFS